MSCSRRKRLSRTLKTNIDTKMISFIKMFKSEKYLIFDTVFFSIYVVASRLVPFFKPNYYCLVLYCVVRCCKALSCLFFVFSYPCCPV